MNYSPPAIQPIPPLYYRGNQQNIISKKPAKPHVSAACVNCKKAHLACDVSRPCKRCVATDKGDSCHDVQHKKRGRPKMMRDSNNKKIRPASTTGQMTFSSTQASSNNNNDTMTILLSMDLCCARVTGESLEYLQLYPQEFSHRSIYDFLIPGENQQCMSKLHRCLLDNAVQHQSRKMPPENTIRSSFEGFYSNAITSLINIANGSLTLKQKLKFRYGNSGGEQEMNCKLYLGGGFGADLFQESSLNQLYIVCIVEAPENKEGSISPTLIQTPLITPITLTAEKPMITIPLAPIFNLLDNSSNSSSSSSLTPPYSSITTDEDEEDDDLLLDEKLLAVGIDCNSSEDEIKSPETTIEPVKENSTTISLLDQFRQKTNLQRNKQCIHPHELYYLNTTSSRLSSEAIARTANPYLSTQLNYNGSSSLSTFNNFHFSK